MPFNKRNKTENEHERKDGVVGRDMYRRGKIRMRGNLSDEGSSWGDNK